MADDKPGRQLTVSHSAKSYMGGVNALSGSQYRARLLRKPAYMQTSFCRDVARVFQSSPDIATLLVAA